MAAPPSTSLAPAAALASAGDPEVGLEAKLAALSHDLRHLGSVLVAFSGGADSAFLLAAAVRALGAGRVAAATAVSWSLPESERAPAADFCRGLGVRHLLPETHEMDREGYRANAGDRCYFCKAELLDVLGPLARAHGLAAVATGTNADDVLAGFRPGIRAASERRAVTPLLDAHLTKADVRAASHAWGLVTWDKPAAACLSSRIAYGVEVTPARLARVERAELDVRTAFAQAGVVLSDLRVRDLDGAVRLELDSPALDQLGQRPDLRAAVAAAIAGAGFGERPQETRAFRSGSMNELLADPSRYR